MRRMYDAAFPPANPPMWEAVAGYLGGNTPNIWKLQDWNNQTLASGADFRLPIFTRSNPETHDPVFDASTTIDKAILLGVPKGVCIALDFETAINAAYVNTFNEKLLNAGYLTLLYGSISTVTHNPKPSGGFWVADWTGQPHLVPGSAATQWSGSGPFGGAFDPSLVADSTNLWRVIMSVQDDVTASLRSFFRVPDKFAVPAGQASNTNIFAALLGSMQKLHNEIAALPDAIIAKLPPGSGLTTDQVKQAVKDALKEGVSV